MARPGVCHGVAENQPAHIITRLVRFHRCKAGDERRDIEAAFDVDASAKDPDLRTLQSLAGSLSSMDTNQLQTALARAIAAEDYTLAAAVRDHLQRTMAEKTGSDQPLKVLDWRSLGVPAWLADRAERLLLKFPTGEVLAVLACDCCWSVQHLVRAAMPCG